MSLFQSGPYQSRGFSYVVRQTRRWTDRIRVSLRELKTIASWSAQILLYPAYVVFQTARLAGATLRRSLELKKFLSAAADQNAVESSITAETPIQRVLQTVQGFSLPNELSVLVVQPSELVQSKKRSHWQPLTQLVEEPETASRSEGLALDGWSGGDRAVPFQGSARSTRRNIQGVASLLDRSLVLITDQNQVLDILTTAQQQQLRQRIIWEVAHYGRYWRLRHAHRSFQRGQSQRSLHAQFDAWTQSQPVQQISEWIQQMARAGVALLGLRRELAGQPSYPKLAASTALPTADTPILHVLQAAQRFSISAPLLAAAKVDEPTRSRNGDRAVHASSDLTISQSEELAIQPQPIVPPDSPAPHVVPASPAVFVQGVASLLPTRSLVLVTNQNQVLDILTPEQQKQLRHHIIWEVASYGRYLQIQQATRWIARLRPSAPERPILPPVRVFQNWMIWVQTSPVAIAANLFQEAALVPAYEFAADESLWIPAALSKPTLAATHAALLVSPSSIDSLSPTPYSPLPTPYSPLPSTPHHSPDYIDIQATLLGYIQSPVEKVLRWLDYLVLWLEAHLVRLWRLIVPKQ